MGFPSAARQISYLEKRKQHPYPIGAEIRKIRMKTPKEKAKRILLDNGFISDYHFILDVMNGNRSSSKIVHVFNTKRWGLDVLEKKRDFLRLKYPKYQSEIFDIADKYIDEFYDFKEEVENIVIKNIEDARNEQKADNSN